MKIMLSTFFSLGTVPIIRCPKGNAAEMVAEVNVFLITSLIIMMMMIIYRRCCGLKLVLVQNFSNWFKFYFLLLCMHDHNVEQWQIKLKPVQKTLNQGQI